MGASSFLFFHRTDKNFLRLQLWQRMGQHLSVYNNLPTAQQNLKRR